MSEASYHSPEKIIHYQPYEDRIPGSSWELLRKLLPLPNSAKSLRAWPTDLEVTKGFRTFLTVTQKYLALSIDEAILRKMKMVVFVCIIIPTQYLNNDAKDPVELIDFFSLDTAEEDDSQRHQVIFHLDTVFEYFRSFSLENKDMWTYIDIPGPSDNQEDHSIYNEDYKTEDDDSEDDDDDDDDQDKGEDEDSYNSSDEDDDNDYGFKNGCYRFKYSK
ncbi:hypothetical protein BGZ81_008724 [Podila clonocystis]|nr:hypothetical protein BGZ81_008724 [Podila clonocystis]